MEKISDEVAHLTEENRSGKPEESSTQPSQQQQEQTTSASAEDTSKTSREETVNLQKGPMARQYQVVKADGGASEVKPEFRPESVEEVFEEFRTLSKKESKAKKRIKIGLPKHTNVDPLDQVVYSKSIDGNNIIAPVSSSETYLQDTLEFFTSDHQEQDPEFIHLNQSRAKEALKKELSNLNQEDTKERQEIEQLIITLVKEKQASTERNIMKYRTRATEEEQKDLERLKGLYQQRMLSNQKKISDGVKLLQQRHQAEIQKVAQQHRQSAQQRQLSDQVSQAEWQNTIQTLRTRHQRQLQDFSAKGEDIKRKTEVDYRQQQDKIRRQYELRRNEIDASREKIYSKLYAHFQQFRQRYLKRHLQKMMKKKEELVAAIAELEGKECNSDPQNTFSPRELAKNAMDDKAELRPPTPVKSTPEWAENIECATAAARHKHRKGVMNQTNRQLSVEIHNEGIWISTITTKEVLEDEGSRSRSEGKNTETTSDKEFIVWGVKAHTILESVLCGEIPASLLYYVSGEALIQQGGQVRCIISDMRTSDETASIDRAIAMREQEEANISELEGKLEELSKLSAEADKALARAEAEEKQCKLAHENSVKELSNVSKILEDFRTKFKNYLNAGKS